MPYYSSHDDQIDWAAVIHKISDDFNNQMQILTTKLNAAIPHIDDDMGALISLVPAPYQLSAPFTGDAATAYQQHAQVLLHETGYRVGGAQMANFLGSEYVRIGEQQGDSEGASFQADYKAGYTRGENGILQMFVDRFDHLAAVVTQHATECINAILHECLSPSAVPTQGPAGGYTYITISDEVVYGIVVRILANRATAHTLNLMLRFGAGALNEQNAINYYTDYISNYNNIDPNPNGIPNDPSVPSQQALTQIWISKCAHVVALVDNFCQQVYNSYRAWSVEFDENINAYYAQRERVFKKLFTLWHLSQAQLAGKDMSQTADNTKDGLSGDGRRTPIGISTGMLDNGQTCVVVNLAGTEPGNILGPNGIPFGDITEATLHNSGYRNDVYNDIQQYLKEHGLPPNTPLIINAHSLGGMVGQDLTQSYNAKTFNLIEVQTYGAPDMGNRPNAHTQLSMYYNHNDPVPTLAGTSKAVLNTSPSDREHLVNMGNPQLQGLDAHGDYRNSPDLSANGKYGSVNYVIAGDTEYYSIGSGPLG